MGTSLIYRKLYKIYQGKNKALWEWKLLNTWCTQSARDQWWGIEGRFWSTVWTTVDNRKIRCCHGIERNGVPDAVRGVSESITVDDDITFNIQTVILKTKYCKCI